MYDTSLLYNLETYETNMETLSDCPGILVWKLEGKLFLFRASV